MNTRRNLTSQIMRLTPYYLVVSNFICCGICICLLTDFKFKLFLPYAALCNSVSAFNSVYIFIEFRSYAELCVIKLPSTFAYNPLFSPLLITYAIKHGNFKSHAADLDIDRFSKAGTDGPEMAN